MEEYAVSIVELRSEGKKDIVVFADEAETTEFIVLKTCVDGKELSASDHNYLTAYQKLRDQLLVLGYGMKCNGSRVNAVQSGMMGASNRIYLVEPGRKALNNDTVYIFDPADISEFPDSKKQKHYFEMWCKSII